MDYHRWLFFCFISPLSCSSCSTFNISNHHFFLISFTSIPTKKTICSFKFNFSLIGRRSHRLLLIPSNFLPKNNYWTQSVLLFRSFSHLKTATLFQMGLRLFFSRRKRWLLFPVGHFSLDLCRSFLFNPFHLFCKKKNKSPPNLPLLLFNPLPLVNFFYARQRINYLSETGKDCHAWFPLQILNSCCFFFLNPRRVGCRFDAKKENFIRPLYDYYCFNQFLYQQKPLKS